MRTVVANSIDLRGWAFSSDGPVSVMIEVNGRFYRPVMGIARDDVVAAFPGEPNALSSGWWMRISTDDWPSGVYPVTVTASSADGATTQLRREVVVDRAAVYERWLEYRRSSPREGPAPELESATPESFFIAVCDSEATPAQVERSRVSLTTQTYSHWAMASAQTPSAALPEFLDADFAYLVLMRAGDILRPHALASLAKSAALAERPQLIYADEDTIDAGGRRADPYFKPGWSPELLLVTDYIGPFLAIDRGVAQRVSELASEVVEGAYDLVVYLVDMDVRVERVPDVLYSRAVGSTMTDTDDLRRSVERLARRRRRRVQISPVAAGRQRVEWELVGSPRVSIVIPTAFKGDFVIRCLRSIQAGTTYPNFEVILVVNNAANSASLPVAVAGVDVRIVECPGAFNYSTVNNVGATTATGEYLLFLNDDTEVQTCDWLERLLEQGQQAQVGAVGAKLVDPNGLLQFGGVRVSEELYARSMGLGLAADDSGYHGVYSSVRNTSAVAGACFLTPRGVFDEIGGFDEAFAVELGDVDFCLRILASGKRVVWTPHAVLKHRERASRGIATHSRDHSRFVQRWRSLLRSGDPYYNPNLSATNEYELRAPGWTAKSRMGGGHGEAVERFVPETTHGIIHAEHEARYRWAAAAVPGKRVLDAGCGVGYGSQILVEAGADTVVGVDISREAIEDAVFRAGDAAEFIAASLERLPFPDGAFDMVVCFEVIEHVQNQDAALNELKRILTPNGVLVLSSPNRNVYSPGNPFHLHEYTPAELYDALAARFVHVALYRQHPWITSLITDDAGLAVRDGIELPAVLRKVDALQTGYEVYTLAVAGVQPLPCLGNVAVLTETVEVSDWSDRLSAMERWLERVEDERGRLASDRDHWINERARWTERVTALTESLADLETERARLADAIDVYEHSRSWRITRPLRRLRRAARRAE